MPTIAETTVHTCEDYAKWAREQCDFAAKRRDLPALIAPCFEVITSREISDEFEARGKLDMSLRHAMKRYRFVRGRRTVLRFSDGEQSVDHLEWINPEFDSSCHVYQLNGVPFHLYSPQEYAVSNDVRPDWRGLTNPLTPPRFWSQCDTEEEYLKEWLPYKSLQQLHEIIEGLHHHPPVLRRPGGKLSMNMRLGYVAIEGHENVGYRLRRPYRFIGGWSETWEYDGNIAITTGIKLQYFDGIYEVYTVNGRICLVLTPYLVGKIWQNVDDEMSRRNYPY